MSKVCRAQCQATVCKCHDFCVIQILRAISFPDCRIAKSAILKHLEGLNFDFFFYEFLHCQKAEKLQNSKPLKWRKQQF